MSLRDVPNVLSLNSAGQTWSITARQLDQVRSRAAQHGAFLLLRGMGSNPGIFFFFFSLKMHRSGFDVLRFRDLAYSTFCYFERQSTGRFSGPLGVHLLRLIIIGRI